MDGLIGLMSGLNDNKPLSIKPLSQRFLSWLKLESLAI